MQLIQTVVVKQILTENSRNKLYEKYQTQKLQLEKECGQLQFESKRLEKTKTFSPSALKNHFEKEIQMREEKVKLLEFQMKQLHMLPLGSELKEKEVQALVDIKVGDQWDERMSKPAIIIKDGMIEEIRVEGEK
jgi:septin family protein